MAFTKAKGFSNLHHSAIYLLIAERISLLFSDHWWSLRLITLIIIWAMAIAGILYKHSRQSLSNCLTIIYIIMDGQAIDIWPFEQFKSFKLLALVLGGLAFTLGAVIYSFK